MFVYKLPGGRIFGTPLQLRTDYHHRCRSQKAVTAVEDHLRRQTDAQINQSTGQSRSGGGCKYAYRFGN
jgi:hypothetical protein